MKESRFHKPDYILLGTTSLLVLTGLFAIASASPVLGTSRFGEAYYFLQNQLIGLVIGVVTLMIGWKIPYTFWRTYAPFLLFFSLILLVLVFIPGVGLELKGASRWIQVGLFTFQPAEIAKLAFIMYLASWIEAKQKNIGNFKMGFLPFLIMVSMISLFFILQPDIGTLGVLVITSLIMFFIGGGRFYQIALLLLLGIMALSILIISQPYRTDRLTVFLNPSEDTQGIGYQLNQSLIAIGSGGWFGRGFGLSKQKFNYVPEAAGDSIFAIYSEEFGFLGSLFLLGLYILFFWRGMKISARAPDGFAKNLAAGITLLIIIQALINIAAISGLMPLTGLPLSFISHGSTALVMNLAQIGILMNISKYTS